MRAIPERRDESCACSSGYPQTPLRVKRCTHSAAHCPSRAKPKSFRLSASTSRLPTLANAMRITCRHSQVCSTNVRLCLFLLPYRHAARLTLKSRKTRQSMLLWSQASLYRGCAKDSGHLWRQLARHLTVPLSSRILRLPIMPRSAACHTR